MIPSMRVWAGLVALNLAAAAVLLGVPMVVVGDGGPFDGPPFGGDDHAPPFNVPPDDRPPFNVPPDHAPPFNVPPDDRPPFDHDDGGPEERGDDGDGDDG